VTPVESASIRAPPRRAISCAHIAEVAAYHFLSPDAHSVRFRRLSQHQTTIKIVVPYPRSGPDILSRLMGDEIGRAQG